MEWRLFADLREVTGEDRVAVDVAEGATVGEALDALLDGRPALRERVLDDEGNLADHVNLLKNGAEVDPDETVTEGDELALFPPVTGG